MVLSAPLLTRKRLIQVKIEATKGSIESTGLSDILVWDLEISPDDKFVERRLSSGFLGHWSPGTLEYAYAGSCKFKAELRLTTTDFVAGLTACIQACGLAKSTGTFTPTSVHATQKTITILVYEDGKKKSLAGCMGNVTMTPADGRVICEFEFQGVWSAVVDAALPTPTFGAQIPVPWGAAANAFSLAAQAIKISTFSLKTGNSLTPRYTNGRVSYTMITDRDPTCEIDPESDLVAGYDLYGAWLAGTTVAISLAVTDATRTLTLTGAKFQYREVKEADRSGIQIDQVTGQFVATNGDDEYSLVVT